MSLLPPDAAGHPGPWSATPLEHRVANMTTAAIERRRGHHPDGTPWSAVVKTLRPASEHPAFAEIPPDFRAQVLEDVHWLDEPAVYRCGLADALPPPLRMPAVRTVEDGPGAVSLWLEDVADVTPWDPARYRRSAEALGALAGRWTDEAATAAFGLRHRDIGRLFAGKVLHHDLPALGDDALWADPVVAGAVDRRLRADLHRLADVVPTLLAAARAGPAGVCHGDATPDNLREPGDGSIVALDWAYGQIGPIGSDLGQLVAGRFETGAAADDDVDQVAAIVVDAFLAGLAREGRHPGPGPVRLAFAVHLAVRSAFTALRFENRPDITDEERREIIGPRARLARFATDLALSQV